ncbi:hypothetical protein [Enterobacter chuandaensis]|nr:hypothetical protein [Enterobacter chuandaensis]
MLQRYIGNFVPFLKKTDSLVAGVLGTAGCVGLWATCCIRVPSARSAAY